METAIPLIGWMLIHFLWQGALVALLLAAMLRAVPAQRADLRASLAAAALGTLLLLPVTTMAALLAGSRPIAAMPGIRGLILNVEAADLSRVEYEPGLFAAALFWGLWIVAQSTRYAGGALIARRMKRLGITAVPDEICMRVSKIAERLEVRAPAIVVSLRQTVPQVTGLLRPVLVLPVSALTGLTPGQLNSILAHELAHIARGDQWWNLVRNAAEVFLGFHPAVWYAGSVLSREREYCCDAVAARECGAGDYASALLVLEETALPAPGIAATGGSLQDRVQRLLGRPVERASATPAVLLAVCSIALGTLGFAQELAPPVPTAPTAPVKPSATAPTPKPVKAPSVSGRPAVPEAPPKPVISQSQDDAIERLIERQHWGQQAELARQLELMHREKEHLHELQAEMQERALEMGVLRAQMEEARALAMALRQESGQEERAKLQEERDRRHRYAEEKFGGADTERGRTYVKFGPPDEIESHPGGFEQWFYRSLPGVGENVTFDFNRDKRPKR